MRPYCSGSISTGMWILGLVLGTRGVMGGYLDVIMEPATECGQSLVQWQGDDGPYHLLLTPTSHTQHGYNVWLPSLPNGTNSHNLSINQPAGLQFVLTMWGSSGISYAGTTDILTVNPSPQPTNGSCFLTDDEILGRYSFSFNITDTSDGYPPQCSNMTMTWPTSLESNVTSSLALRGVIDDGMDDAGVEEVDVVGPASQFRQMSAGGSSSEHEGNTTYPPSMFGVIPLGNSFSIPITYDRHSKYAAYLPESSRSDDPTTWTTKGVTYLNWTIPLARGTRFILVAGIGSDQQWASGGSSALLTVGQGSTDCSFVSGPDPKPSVTATTGTYTDIATGDANSDSGKSGPGTVVRTVLACVFSILATLTLVGLFLFCYRARRRRRAAALPTAKYPSGGSLGKLNRAGYDQNSSDYPLDLIASRDSRAVAPILTDTEERVVSPVDFSPANTLDSMNRMFIGETSESTMGSQDSFVSPTSPTQGRHAFSRTEYARQSSTDPLLAGSIAGRSTPSGTDTYTSTGASSHRPLMLHDRAMGMPFEEEEEDMPDLKRETLAMGESQIAGPGPGTAGRRGPPRRRQRDEEMEYVVHRDAGRVRNETNEGRRVLELPPRYEELNWEGEMAEDRRGS